MADGKARHSKDAMSPRVTGFFVFVTTCRIGRSTQPVKQPQHSRWQEGSEVLY